MTTDNTTSEPDCRVKALAFALQIIGLRAYAAQIAHQSGKRALDETDLQRAARRFPVKARTSALDYASEAAIRANMRRICQNRTVILIAHRLTTLRHAARIVAIEAGRLIEDGTHEALLRAGGRYAQLWRLQSREPEPLSAAVGD